MKPGSLLIAGCGYLGLTLAKKLSGEGWKVWGLRRSPESAALVGPALQDALSLRRARWPQLRRTAGLETIPARHPGDKPRARRGAFLWEDADIHR